jgi:2-haloacid dehalogenase
MQPKMVVFDLGGVLIDWNPRYLYRKIFNREEDMEYFLREIASPDWNEEQDG